MTKTLLQNLIRCSSSIPFFTLWEVLKHDYLYIFYARYMYEKTGVRKTAIEFLDFLDLCNATPGSFAGSTTVSDGVSQGPCVQSTAATASNTDEQKIKGYSLIEQKDRF